MNTSNREIVTKTSINSAYFLSLGFDLNQSIKPKVTIVAIKA